MKRILFAFLSIVGAASCASPCASASTVEDGDLGAMTDVVASIIYSDRSFDIFRSLSCKMIGEKIPLSSAPAVTTYFVTTADACGWGAALGPIWLIGVSGGVASILLSTGGYSVDVLNEEGNGMRSVKVGGDVAGRTALVGYRFDGKKYRIKKEGN